HHRVVLAARLRDVGPLECAHAAVLAKEVMAAVAVELIVGEVLLARQEPEGFRLDAKAPQPRLAADRTVALGRSSADVEVRLELAAAAVATAGVCRHRHGFSPARLSPCCSLKPSNQLRTDSVLNRTADQACV